MENQLCPKFLVHIFIVVPFCLQVFGPSVINFRKFRLLAFCDDGLAVVFCGVGVGVGVQSGDDIAVVTFLYFLGDVAVFHACEQFFKGFAFFGFAGGEGFCRVGIALFFCDVGDVCSGLHFGEGRLCGREYLCFFFLAHVNGLSLIVGIHGGKYHTGDGRLPCLVIADVGVCVFDHIFLHFGCQCIFFVYLCHIVFGGAAFRKNLCACCIFGEGRSVLSTLLFFFLRQRSAGFLRVIVQNDNLLDAGNDLFFRVIFKCHCISFVIGSHVHCPKVLSKIAGIGCLILSGGHFAVNPCFFQGNVLTVVGEERLVSILCDFSFAAGIAAAGHHANGQNCRERCRSKAFCIVFHCVPPVYLSSAVTFICSRICWFLFYHNYHHFYILISEDNTYSLYSGMKVLPTGKCACTPARDRQHRCFLLLVFRQISFP